jgi:nitrate reductase delta subunit
MSLGQTGVRAKGAERSNAIARVREWTRQRFLLSSDDTVLVAELECALPGCPPLETVIAFWIGDQRHHLKLFKSVVEVRLDDLPPSWFRSALAVDGNFDGDCC